MGLRMGGCKAIEGGMGGSDYLCRHDSSRLSPRLIGHPRPSNPYDTHFNYLNVAPPSKPSLPTITTTLCMCMSSPWSWQWRQAGCAASESENIGGGHFLECNPTLTISFIVGLDTPVPLLVASTMRIANSFGKNIMKSFSSYNIIKPLIRRSLSAYINSRWFIFLAAIALHLGPHASWEQHSD